MSVIDYKWLETDAGSQVLNSVRAEKRLKSFGVLEKPALAGPPFPLYDEVGFKVVILGNSFCGKTSFLGAISQNKTTPTPDKNDYVETPGIHISHLYWPCKVVNRDKFVMFDLAMWDVGKAVSTKYAYILPSYSQNIDCFIFIFSWTDKQSFLETYENIRKLYESDPASRAIPKLIIGTKFDLIIHSEIEQEMIDELEEFTQTKVIRFSSTSCSFAQISALMNTMCEKLWIHRQN